MSRMPETRSVPAISTKCVSTWRLLAGPAFPAWRRRRLFLAQHIRYAVLVCFHPYSGWPKRFDNLGFSDAQHSLVTQALVPQGPDTVLEALWRRIDATGSSVYRLTVLQACRAVLAVWSENSGKVRASRVLPQRDARCRLARTQRVSMV